jgi:hypothetical protein
MSSAVHLKLALRALLAAFVTLVVAACNAPSPPATVQPPTAAPIATSEPTLSPTATTTSTPTPTQTPVVLPSPTPSPTPYVPPSAEVVKLADAAMLTDRARELFYASRPVIDPDRATLDKHCRGPASKTSVELGCYTPDGRIYILKIVDRDLKSQMTVIAAHEVLHAAYAAISASETGTLTAHLESLAKQIDDVQLQAALKDYSQIEPGQRANELHSILGTEYAALTPYLEQHYLQYFKQRDVIVAAARQFRRLLTDAQKKVNDLQNRLTSLRKAMNDEKKSGNIKAYNSDVDRYNALVKQYNAAIADYNRYRKIIIGS